MLKRRLIPKLQMSVRKNFRGNQPVLVVTNQFDNRRSIGDPLSQAKIYEAQLADELILLDLDRSADSWSVLLNTLELISQSLATPLSVGGGLNSFEQVQALLDRGADKVVVNSSALTNPSLIQRISSSYGTQCVVASIDVRLLAPSVWRVFSDNGRVDTQLDLLDWARRCADLGAGELIVTSIDNDGSCQGLDLDLISVLTSNLDIPVIASGGCGLSQHFVDGYNAGAAAVAAGTFFCSRDQNPMQCRSHIRNAGIPIRLEV